MLIYFTSDKKQIGEKQSLKNKHQGNPAYAKQTLI